MTSTTTGKSHKNKAGEPNRLINETSTYLLQHAYNPVDWYPWGAEALERARQEDKPILLSIGYAACHWCHVMEHESFEDEETALLMNANFVCVKVDREERTDLDEIYMKAVQLMTGHGGWPMTVFLTPGLKPFYGGTYFPPQDRHGLPGFKRLLLALTTAWKEQRPDLNESSDSIIAHMQALDHIGQSEPAQNLSYDLIDQAIARLLSLFDDRWGGFGNAPKFPHSFSIDLAMRCAMPNYGGNRQSKAECLEMIETTLNRMAYGGIHDQLGGGFARYSVDRQWLIPHFEKMLYDNALLAQTYLNGYLLTGRKYWAEVARGIFEFVLRELTNEQGGFFSSLDADSEGVEGKFYAWSTAEIKELLGDRDAQFFADVFGVTETGNFEHGTSVLHLRRSPEETAAALQMSVDELWQRLAGMREKLLARRELRVRPGRDEKVLTSWNSLMISALVDGYRTLKDERYLAAAITAAQFVMSQMLNGSRLLRTWGQGKAKLNGYLDDYAYLAQAMLDLASVDANPLWFDTALSLAKEIIERFRDSEHGGLYYTSDDHEELVTRPKTFYDGSIPSGTSVAASVFLRLAKLTGDVKHQQRAEELMNLYSAFMARVPDQFSNLLNALEFYLADGPEIALVLGAGEQGGQSDRSLLHSINERYLPDKVLIVGSADSSGKVRSSCPLLTERHLIDGNSTVYICKSFTCRQPVTSISSLNEELDAIQK